MRPISEPKPHNLVLYIYIMIVIYSHHCRTISINLLIYLVARTRRHRRSSFVDSNTIKQ